MKADEAKRLKRARGENARLKKLLAEAELDKRCSRSWPRETSDPGAAPAGGGRLRRSLRGLRTAGVPGRRSAPLDPTRRVAASPGRGRRSCAAGCGRSPREHPRWGWKTAHAILRREGWHVNRKRTSGCGVTRACAAAAAALQTRRVRPAAAAAPGRAPEPCVGARLPVRRDRRPTRLKLLNIVDEHTREALAMRVGRTCTAETSSPSSNRSSPSAARRASAHGQRTRAHRLGAARLVPARRHGTSYIEPGSPWENPFVESFNGRVRDELLNIEEFGSLLEAQVVVEAWRIEYNTYRPHSPSAVSPPPSTPSMDHQPTSTPMTAGPLNGAPSRTGQPLDPPSGVAGGGPHDVGPGHEIVITATVVDTGTTVAHWIYRVVAAILVAIRSPDRPTGARTMVVWFKICVGLLAVSAVLLTTASVA